MLSRVADALFWMSRYLERAEHVARLLDVCFHLDLDLHGLMSGHPDMHWAALLSIVQPSLASRTGGNRTLDPDAISESLMFDLSNHESVMSCVNRARSNARSVR